MFELRLLNILFIRSYQFMLDYIINVTKYFAKGFTLEINTDIRNILENINKSESFISY